jgi:hypothetical protein
MRKEAESESLIILLAGVITQKNDDKHLDSLNSFQKTCQISSAFPVLLVFNAAGCTSAFIMFRAED